MKEAKHKLEKWGPLLAETGDEDMSRGGAKKKAVKGDAMLRALYAFTDKYGWEKK